MIQYTTEHSISDFIKSEEEIQHAKKYLARDLGVVVIEHAEMHAAIIVNVINTERKTPEQGYTSYRKAANTEALTEREFKYLMKQLEAFRAAEKEAE